MHNVLFFADVREKLGCSAIQVQQTHRTVAELYQYLSQQHSALAAYPKKNLCVAINQEMAQFDSLLPENSEVAFFPPITGG